MSATYHLNEPVPVSILTGAKRLEGILYIPADCQGLSIVATPNGDQIDAQKSEFIRAAMTHSQMGALQVSLLSDEEALDAHNMQDIPFLSRRLLDTTRFLLRDEVLRVLPLAYFANGGAAAAALMNAAALGVRIRSVAIWGGWPDLAWTILQKIQSPTMFIVGWENLHHDALNRIAFSQLRCPGEYCRIPGADAAFTTPGTFEQMVWTAVPWLQRHFHELPQQAAEA